MKVLLTRKCQTALTLIIVAAGFTLNAIAAGHDGNRTINLVSDLPGLANITDTNLLNPWGILSASGGTLIVADNHAGVATFYTRSGHPIPSLVSVPSPDGGSGAVTDLALNNARHSFIVTQGHRRDESVLLFATEDGTLAGWSPKVDAGSAVIVVDHSGDGAIYKSAALGDTHRGPMLYVANFGQGVVQMYDGSWHLVKSFTDPGLTSAHYSPFGLRVIGERLFVTFAFKTLPTDGDETAGPGLGYVDEFDLGGNFIRRFASQGTLNAPWGLALAPRGFGKFGGAMLVGNFGDGAINAFSPRTGAFLGQLSDTNGVVIQIEGLWGLAFGSNPRSLYFTAGPGDENHGLLGILRADSGGADDGDDDDQ
jgi:uncharacterized protein (TIGR03118 family)